MDWSANEQFTWYFTGQDKRPGWEGMVSSSVGKKKVLPNVAVCVISSWNMRQWYR